MEELQNYRGGRTLYVCFARCARLVVLLMIGALFLLRVPLAATELEIAAVQKINTGESLQVCVEPALPDQPKDQKKSDERNSKAQSHKPANEDEPAKELLSGKVVPLVEALQRRGIKSADEMKGQVVLETANGELWPIVSDWRGRAFFQDERLRNRPVELIVRRHMGNPYLQVLMVFTFDEQGTRQYMDYWCDICSIPMYEIKDCDCCQGPIRLRFQKQELPAYVRPGAKER